MYLSIQSSRLSSRAPTGGRIKMPIFQVDTGVHPYTPSPPLSLSPSLHRPLVLLCPHSLRDLKNNLSFSALSAGVHSFPQHLRALCGRFSPSHLAPRSSHLIPISNSQFSIVHFNLWLIMKKSLPSCVSIKP